MNRKGFTLVELLATIIILGVVVGITIFSNNEIFGIAKRKTEDVFVSSIEDAMDMYLSGNNPTDEDGNKLIFGENSAFSISKKYDTVSVYKAETTFQSVIKSKYEPITQKDLVNPSNEKKCEEAVNIKINIYRDDDYVYYYCIDKGEFKCLTDNGLITNLPGGYDCDDSIIDNNDSNN